MIILKQSDWHISALRLPPPLSGILMCESLLHDKCTAGSNVLKTCSTLLKHKREKQNSKKYVNNNKKKKDIKA